MKHSENPNRGRDAAELFLGTCGPVTRENYQEHVANAEYDARAYGWSLETLGWLREQLAKRLGKADGSIGYMQGRGAS